MTDNEKLIKEAAEAMRRAHAENGFVTLFTDWARVALAVFEKSQGEPSDAQVEAAGALLYGISWGTDIADPDLVRDALRAAGGVR